jgi:hypothetical protein
MQNRNSFSRATGAAAPVQPALPGTRGRLWRAPVAQLDRALAYEARGREFESLRAYQLHKNVMLTALAGRDCKPNFQGLRKIPKMRSTRRIKYLRSRGVLVWEARGLRFKFRAPRRTNPFRCKHLSLSTAYKKRWGCAKSVPKMASLLCQNALGGAGSCWVLA